MLDLLEELGIDPEDFNWMLLGTCNNSDFTPRDFYDRYEESEEHAKLMDEMCLGCPVMRNCSLRGQRDKEYGLWGGVYWDGTGKPDMKRNEHKTKETWQRVAEKLK